MSAIVDEQVENAAEDSGSEDGIKGLEEIPSMCMQCGGSGITRMLMHKIPHFREVIIASFSCDECDEFNNEVTFGGEIQLQGSVITLHVVNKSDLNRQIVKSDSASLKILEIDFLFNRSENVKKNKNVLITYSCSLRLFPYRGDV